MFNSIVQHLVREHGWADQMKARHTVGKLELFGVDLHQFFDRPFFKGHDYNAMVNLTTGERIAIDPSVNDYLRIEQVAEKKDKHMSNSKNYSQWTDEELLAQQKSLKRYKNSSAIIIGFLVGVMIYGAASKGFGWVYTLIPLLLIAGVYKNSQTQKKKLEAVRSEMDTRRGGEKGMTE